MALLGRLETGHWNACAAPSQGLIDAWCDYALGELYGPAMSWLGPLLGFYDYNKQVQAPVAPRQPGLPASLAAPLWVSSREDCQGRPLTLRMRAPAPPVRTWALAL